MSKSGNTVNYEINKSLDELVSEDQALNRHQGSGSHSKTRGYNANRSEDRDEQVGRYEQRYRGGGGDRDRRGGGAAGYNNSSRGGFRNGDEREMVVDAYGKNVQGRRLFVSNLAYETQWKYLKDHMRVGGDVVRADIFEKKDGASRGIGVVEFRTKHDAQRALQKLDQTMLDGRKLHLKEDTEGHIFPALQSKKDFYERNTAQTTEYRPFNHHQESTSSRGRGNYPYKRRSRSRSRSDSPRQRGNSFKAPQQQSANQQSQRHHHQSRENAEEEDNVAPQKRLTIQKRKDAPNSRSASPKVQQTFSIHISNLPYSVDRNQLREAFKDFGKTMHTSVSLDERGQSRGFGVIEYDTKEAAMSAAQSMNKASFNGREVIVKYYAN